MGLRHLPPRHRLTAPPQIEAAGVSSQAPHGLQLGCRSAYSAYLACFLATIAYGLTVTMRDLSTQARESAFCEINSGYNYSICEYAFGAVSLPLPLGLPTITPLFVAREHAGAEGPPWRHQVPAKVDAGRGGCPVHHFDVYVFYVLRCNQWRQLFVLGRGWFQGTSLRVRFCYHVKRC